jgi:hypothetical protein
MQNVNLILWAAIWALTLALIFSKQLHRLLVNMQLRNRRNVALRAYVKRDYYDIETGEQFSKWHMVRGFRLRIANMLLK